MSRMSTEDELRNTLPFGTPAPAAQREITVARLPQAVAQEKATVSRPGWDLTPPLRTVATPRPKPPKVYEEVTAVGQDPRRSESAAWIDVHAVVDAEGRLKLPERVARDLREGTVVELRLARWAVADDVARGRG